MRPLTLVAALCLALPAVSCGSSSTGAFPERELDPADSGAAERAALGWYRAIGEREPLAVIAAMTEAARRPLKLDRTRVQVEGSFGAWAAQTEPAALYSERRGATTTVFMRVDGGERYGPHLVHRGTLLLALPLEREAGAWRVDDSAWFRSQVDRFHDADAWRRQWEEAVPDAAAGG